MPVVTTTLFRPDGVTPFGGRIVTIGQVGATLTDNGTVLDRLRKASDPTTGVVSFTLAPSAVGSYYVWTFPDGTQVEFVVPSGAGPYQLADIVTTQLPAAAGVGVSAAQLASGLAGKADTSALANYAPQGLPAYAPAGLIRKFDPTTGLYGVTPVNNRAFATALGKASVGSGVCHDVFIGASDMSAFDGLNLRAPLSWPEYYRQTLASNGVPTGGTGMIPTSDPAGFGLWSDSRLVRTGTWGQFGGGTIYTSTNGDYVTFTTDVAVDAAGKLVVLYDNEGGKPPFTVKVGAAAAVTVTPSNSGSPIAAYTVVGAIAAGTQIVITLAGSGALVVYHIGTVGSVGYHKHNLARSGTGAISASAGGVFDTFGNKGAGSWDPAAPGSNYSAIGPQSYDSLFGAGVQAHRITVSMGPNDLLAGHGYTAAQIIASIQNMIVAVPQVTGGATVRIEFMWHYYPIAAAAWEAFGTALYSFCEANGYQLVDWRSILGNATDMANSGILGADAGHISLAPQLNFGRKLALADLAAA